jgi:hypothetical protein
MSTALPLIFSASQGPSVYPEPTRRASSASRHIRDEAAAAETAEGDHAARYEKPAASGLASSGTIGERGGSHELGQQ